MKNTYSTNLNLPQVDLGILIFRIAIGAMMLTHGVPKLLRLFSGEEITFGDPLGIGQVTTFTLAVFAEFVCAVLVIIGLGTKLAVWPIIATMATAALIVHANDGWGAQERPLLFLFGFLLLFFTGSGKYSLDWFLLSRKK